MKPKTRKGVSIMVIFCVLFGIYQSFRLTNIMLNKTKEPAINVITVTNELVGSVPNIIEEEEVKEKKEETKEVMKEVVITETKKEPVATTQLKNSNKYRLTSFYANDGYGTGSCTGTGLCAKDFSINEKGWYTYDGYLVLAGATEELLRSWKIERNPDKHYFRYYDKVNLEIDGITYQGIIIDSCGSCTKLNENRIDLFVSNSSSVVDRGYKGKGMINLWY